MNEDEANAIRSRIRQWENASKRMSELKAEEILVTDTAQAMHVFEGSAEWAARNRPPNPWSGLVEQQRWFAILRRS